MPSTAPCAVLRPSFGWLARSAFFASARISKRGRREAAPVSGGASTAALTAAESASMLILCLF